MSFPHQPFDCLLQGGQFHILRGVGVVFIHKMRSINLQGLARYHVPGADAIFRCKDLELGEDSSIAFGRNRAGTDEVKLLQSGQRFRMVPGGQSGSRVGRMTILYHRI